MTFERHAAVTRITVIDPFYVQCPRTLSFYTGQLIGGLSAPLPVAGATSRPHSHADWNSCIAAWFGGLPKTSNDTFEEVVCVRRHSVRSTWLWPHDDDDRVRELYRAIMVYVKSSGRVIRFIPFEKHEALVDEVQTCVEEAGGGNVSFIKLTKR